MTNNNTQVYRYMVGNNKQWNPIRMTSHIYKQNEHRDHKVVLEGEGLHCFVVTDVSSCCFRTYFAA